MLTIHLDELKFHAFHGLYAEEAITGSAYTMKIDITIASPAQPVHSIDQTIDYSAVYALAKNFMQTNTPLLETIVMKLAHEIANQYKLAHAVIISLFKEQAPIPSLEGRVGVTYTWSRN